MPKLGDEGLDVIEIQKILGLHPDGEFGPITAKAVRKFQRDHGLHADGIVGTNTLKLLFPSTDLQESDSWKNSNTISNRRTTPKNQ